LKAKERDKILITGASGLLGSKMIALAREHYKVLSTYNTKPLFPGSVKMDITNESEVLHVFRKFRPKNVVHTAAETNVDKCETDKKHAWKINAAGTRNVAEASKEIGAKMVYVSTDYVFDGEKRLYREEDEPNPINYYGVTKLEGEKYVADLCKDYIIARTSVLYGWHPWKSNFVKWVIESLRKGKQISVVNDHFNSPTLADNLAEILLEIIRKDLKGIYHTAGSERINRFDFTLKIAEIFNLDSSLVKPIKMSELKVWVAKRPRDSSLRVDKIQRELKTKPLSVEEGLWKMRETEKMKGVILHGGYGTRLRPLTHTGPKQLIPVANKPISQYVLEDLRNAGITDIAIILGDVYPEKVKEHYGDGSRLGVEIKYIHQGEPRGIAQAISLCEDFVGDSPFVVYLGDNLLKGGIEKFTKEFGESTYDGMILLCEVENPQRFGVAEFDKSGKLIRLVEKPKEPPSNYALTGIYFFRPKIFEMIKRLKPSWRGELEITEAIQLLIDSGYDVSYKFVEGWWKDTGAPEDLLESNRLILDEMAPKIQGNVEEGATLQGRVSIGKGSTIKSGAILRGPAVIGENTLIDERVYIGPYTSIGNNVVIARGEIENSIVMDNCQINVHEKITDSLIGPDSKITTNLGAPRGYRFIIGEGSRITV